jgi:hypothetical protein
MARFRNVSKQDLEVPSLGREVKAGATVDVPASLREQFDESPLFEHVAVKKTAPKKRTAKKSAPSKPTAESTPTPDAAGITATTTEGDGA